MNSCCINPNKSEKNCASLINNLKACPINSCESINKCINDICSIPHCSASLLISNSSFNEELTNKMTNSIFKDAYCTYMLINKKPNLSPNIKKQALKVVSGSIFYSKRLILSKKLNFDDKIQLIENCNYQPWLINSYLKQTPKKNNNRNQLIGKIMDGPDNLFSLACNGYLSNKEKCILHKEYGEYYFNKFKRNFKSYYLYCKVFHRQINFHEIELLYDKLLDKKNHGYVHEALKLFNFKTFELEKLESIHIAMILIS